MRFPSVARSQWQLARAACPESSTGEVWGGGGERKPPFPGPSGQLGGWGATACLKSHRITFLGKFDIGPEFSRNRDPRFKKKTQLNPRLKFFI